MSPALNVTTPKSKLEESLLIAVEETGNKTIYALRQDQQLQYQLLPLASAMRVDLEEEASLVPLGNGSIGNSMQADGTVLPESTSLPAVASVLSSSTANTSETVAVVAGAAKNDRKKLKTQQDMQDTTSRNSSSNNEKSKLQGSLVSSSCSSSYEKQIEGRPRTCEQIQLSGFTTSGVYRIYPFDIERNGTEVYCDLHSDKGGWTVIQRRNELFGKRVDFERSWHEYAVGFGITHDSYWLGLNTISELTKSGDYEIQIELTDWEEDVRVAKYAYFRIANSSEKFRIHVADYSGNAGDSLAYHNGMAFTTKDSDNDLEKNVNCAQKYHGAWWYKSCHQSNLNGLYTDESNGKHESYANGVNWYSWHGYYYSLKRTEMKIRSRHFEAYLRESRE
ncbi:unnamed protein product [Orchesella dallaii]|uniref:Fibrinogen C-terminal domain-containing protein n=1 Tax=Orchesella dallaii TaxID=48710 RepID=A0ABP1QBV4_9HEXA